MKLYLITGILIGIILICIIAILKINKKLRESAYNAFLIAEKKFKNGNEKMDYAISNIYFTLLPDYLKLFISEDTFKNLSNKLIQKLFNEVSDFLNDGKLNHK